MSSAKDSRIPAELETRIDLAEGLAIFRFSLSREFLFQPGQYATLWLTHRGETIPRPYSIASSSTETRALEFYINLVENGRLTPSLWDPEVMRSLQSRGEDTNVAVTGPRGRFVLDLEDPRGLVFVASGTGLAPFISMTRRLNEHYLASPGNFQPRSITIIHGVSYSENLGYRSELEALASETHRDPSRKLAVFYYPTISRPYLDPSWTGLRGRAESVFEDPSPGFVTSENSMREMIRTKFRPDTHAVYVCGHPGTIDNTVRLLSARGFKPDMDLKVEKYYP